MNNSNSNALFPPASLPEIVDLLIRHKFTLNQAENFLSRRGLHAVLDYIFYINQSKGGDHANVISQKQKPFRKQEPCRSRSPQGPGLHHAPDPQGLTRPQ
jgi:hypothetical protein